MTAADILETKVSKFKRQDFELKRLPHKKIYHSDRYIYLDPSEFGIISRENN